QIASKPPVIFHPVFQVVPEYFQFPDPFSSFTADSMRCICYVSKTRKARVKPDSSVFIVL
ncbi:MAG: hypothetical protein PHF31_12415, partial [Methylobacter sp.]|nr:hypothetical protein [Methylobacter sp.]